MPKNGQKTLEIRCVFNENTNDEEQLALWQQVFNILGVFDDEHMNKEIDKTNT